MGDERVANGVVCRRGGDGMAHVACAEERHARHERQTVLTAAAIDSSACFASAKSIEVFSS